MSVKDIIVRLQTLAGMWETVGVDRMRGILPEVDQLAADEWGPSTASFSLHRDPGVTWPDLSAYTPVEIDVGGLPVWDGRISETPAADGDDPVVNVQCKGWRVHLDDDPYERTYVHTKLADWRDARSFLNESLAGGTSFTAAGVVTTGDGLITLGWPDGAVLPADACVGVKLDMGDGQTASSVAVEVHGITGSANSAAKLYAVGSSSEAGFGSGANYAFAAPTLVTIGTSPNLYEGDLTTPSRYITICLNVPAGVTLNGDVTLRIAAITVVTDPAYIVPTSTVSVLDAPTIVRDALDRGTILLSADRSGIDPTGAATFNFDSFALEGAKTPREVIDAANAPMMWRTKIAVGRRMIFEPKPAVAAIEIGDWPGAQFADSSSNDGEEIYNRVSVEGTGPDGQRMSIERSASQQPGVVATPLTTPVADNPSFAANTATWTPTGGSSITRDTGTFDTTPASGRWDRGAGVAVASSDSLTETFTGTFLAGVTYTLTLKVRPSVVAALHSRFGDARGIAYFTAGVFSTLTLSWTPTVTTSGSTLRLNASGAWWYIDTLALTAAQPTLVDRRGFRRTHVLPVKSSLTPGLAQQIGDTFLGAHRTTPLKGTVKVTGDGAVRHVLTGQSIAPEALLLMTGDMLRLSHRIDPDTGGQGRDGRIAEVVYRPAADEATVALDSRRTSVEAMLERLAIVVGTG